MNDPKIADLLDLIRKARETGQPGAIDVEGAHVIVMPCAAKHPPKTPTSPR